ncbi:MAG: S9 family peptidase, partial [Krumholzibacteria bacterium]|nr:S9 family peptidase [Candidatus Krumholzibacteria bacterium]
PAAVHPAALLVAGPVPVPLPAFHDADRAGVTLDDLLGEQTALPGDSWPAVGRSFPAPGGELSWREAATASFTPPHDVAATAWTAVFVHTDRWQKAKLTVVSPRPLKGMLDGKTLALAKGAGDTLTADLELEIGKHVVVLRSLFEPAKEGDWALTLTVTPDAKAGDGTLALTTSPERVTDVRLVLDAPRCTDLALSPDGALVALTLKEVRHGSAAESWLEIRATQDGKLVDLWRGGGAPSDLRWLDTGRRLSWRTDTDGKATLWLRDLDTATFTAAVAGVEKMGSWLWAPDGSFVVYELKREPEADKRKVKRVVNPADRQAWYRNRNHLVQCFVPGGATRRLTAGPVSPDSWRIAPDGRSLLFFLSEQDLATRPYFTSELWLLDLGTLEAQKLLDDRWIGGAEFSPDGKTLLLSGSVSAFGGLGRDLPEGMQANDYGGQLYLWSLADRAPVAATRGLVPDVESAAWCAADGMIYAKCIDTQYVNIYRAKPGKGEPRWEKVQTGLGATDQIALPRRGGTAVARGSDATTPHRVHTIDLKANKSRLLLDPGAEAWQDVAFGRSEPWTAALPDGARLDGRIWYPPGFDPSRTYPLIVYYYGGTSPIDVTFGGRYPKNVWAGQGYVVYTPNPSGATGYGQEFAARHVNDWGRLTAREVIESTRAFLAAHPWADAEAVGCIGASYGGFLTEYILTQTDIFAAGVSHAGISSISSYWGEGLWGYAYGARALADAFPWSDRDLYVEQSALFSADRITTPLLLVHGDSDTNVPVGESDQLFTALKLLGREVEYVQFQGQDHFVLDHGQRIVWNDTILAFFAKHLKQRPAWWEALHPEPKDWR